MAFSAHIRGIRTNLLFFTKGAPTKEIWFYEHPYPNGVKSYNKTKPIRIEEFEPEKAWWHKREKNERAWKVSIDEIKAGGYNLDIKNPIVVNNAHRDPEELLAEYRKLLAGIAETRKIQKSDPIMPIDVEDFPFALPKGWEWGRLGDICLFITDGSHNSPPSVSIGYPYITVRDIVNDHIDFDNCKFVAKESYENLKHNGCKPELWDVLFSKDGTVGKVTVIESEKEFVVLSSLAILRPKIDALYPFFLKYLLKPDQY